MTSASRARSSGRWRRLAALALVLAALAPAQARRGKWYDHYEDALQALEAGENQQAIELLGAALANRKRSGYFRTYGNNYVRYVPHFYLGVAYHDTGDCERALQSFARSEAAGETPPDPSLAARLRSLRAACEARLAPPPPPPVVASESSGASSPPPDATPPPERATAPDGDPDPTPARVAASVPVPEPRPAAAEPPSAPAASETAARRPTREASRPASKPTAPPPIRIDRARLERGITAYLEGNLDAAISAFESLSHRTPRSARLHLLLGMALHSAWAVGGESDDALLERSRRELGTAARLDPRLVPDPALCPPRVAALFRSLR